MRWITATTAAVCWLGLLIQIQQVVGKCELTPYKAAKTVSQITTNLQHIVTYCEKKIVEVEARKKALENELKQLESLNYKSAQEKREKEKKMKNLNEAISKLGTEIRRLEQRIATTTKHRHQVTKRIGEAERRIVAASNRVNQLTRSIRGKQAHIEALNRRIAKERAKRRCHFGRKRRSVERAPRVRRGWRVRRFVRKLIAQRDADSRTLNTLNTSLRSMQTKKTYNINLKTMTNRNICLLNHRITELTKLLQTTDTRLKFLREAKTKILSILTQLKAIRNEKLADLEETEEAGEDVDDLLEDIKEINEAIRKSVETLIQITCGSTFTRRYVTGGTSRVMKVTTGGKCGSLPRSSTRPRYPIIRRPRPIRWRRRAPKLTARDIMDRNRG